MATEKRLIDANALIEKFRDHKDLFLNKMGGFQALLQREKGRVDELDSCIADVINAPTVDAIPVDEIQVDIVSLSLENQEAVLSVSICGKPNEVKLPFSKEVAEVVHGRWHNEFVKGIRGVFGEVFVCSECKTRYLIPNMNYCPNCGAAMKEVTP